MLRSTYTSERSPKLPLLKYPDKGALKKQLLRNGLKLLHDNGYKNTSVDDIVHSVKIAKGTFYALFPSKEVFALQALLSLHDTFLALQAREMKKDISTYERYSNVVGNAMKSNGIFFLSQPEQVEVFSRLSADSKAEYEREEKAFYLKAVLAFGKDPEVCKPAVLGNLMMLHFLTLHSYQHIPVLFADAMAETTDNMVKAVATYIDEH